MRQERPGTDLTFRNHPKESRIYLEGHQTFEQSRKMIQNCFRKQTGSGMEERQETG